MTGASEDRLKRMRMRSWRRGTKEMDLILGPYADARLSGLSVPELDLYDGASGRERPGSGADG